MNNGSAKSPAAPAPAAGTTTPAPRRRRTPSADMEATLLDAAADLLEREGPDALSVRRIAAEANVAPMGVYSRFASKNGIVEALFIQGFDQLAQALESLDAITDPLEGLRVGGGAYRALALAHPMMYQIMFLRPVPNFEPSEEAILVANRAFNGLANAVSRAMDAGVLAPGSPTETAHLIWASVHGWVSLEILGMGDVEDNDAAFSQLCNSLLRGLGPTASAD